MKKYIGLETLSYFFEKLSEKFSNIGHTHIISDVSNLQTTLNNKANVSHSHNDIYYTETEIDSKLVGKSDISHNHNSSYDAKGSADAALASAKVYADNVSTTVKNELLNGAGGAYDSLKELGDLIDDNTDAIEALEIIASGKANASHTHSISNITNLQSTLDGKAASSHGTHVSYSTTTPVMDGTASVGSASTVARSDHKHPIDTSRAAQVDLDAHASDTTKHITSAERTNWNAAKTHADSSHAPSNAQPNQNAFSNITVGSTTISANTTTDTVTLVGSNITITPDATNDKVTFTVADATTSTKGLVQLTNSTSSTSTTTAATPNSVKTAYDLANTAKTAATTAQATADSKANASHTHTVANISDLTATATELNYIDGVTSNVQTQLNNKASSTHNHGLLHTDFTKQIDNTTVDSGWSMINSSYSGFLLKSLRTQKDAPAWTIGNYSSGIVFGGADTKGIITHAYNSPQIRFAGGNGDKPVWNFTLNASSGKTYTLPSSDGTIALTSSNITGNAATATNVAWSGVTSKPSYYDAKAIKSITRSGTTFTYTCMDDTTGTFTQQDNNTTYSVATTSANGLMSSSDKSKLDGIASGANNYTHPSYTARTGTPTANATLTHGGTFTVTQPVCDATGHITALNTRTYTLPSDNNTDTKVTNTLATTTKAYVTGTTSASTNTGTQVFDTGVYLDTTAGQLTATTFNGTTFSGSGVATLAEVQTYLGI